MSWPGTYGISIRGADNWATVHPAYMSYFRIFGGKDFIEKDGMLTSDLNSSESLTMNEKWAELIRSGSNEAWQDTPWYICADDFGYGKSAMLLDADTIGLYVNNNKQYPESGNIAWVPLPLPEGYDKRYSNIWTWTLSMNSRSDEKLASWLFIQYFTGYDQLYQSATSYDNGDIPRVSIWEDSAYREKLTLNKGYIEAFEASIGDASILFTPQPYFFETTTLWANRLREMIVDRNSDIEAELNRLKEDMDRIVHE